MPPTPAATATAVLYQVASGQAVGCGDSGAPPPPPAQSITLTALGGLSATAGGAALSFSAQVANPVALPLNFTLQTVSGPTATPSPSSSTWSLGDLNKAVSATWAAAGTSVIRVQDAIGAVSNSLPVTVAASPTPPPPPPGPAPSPSSDFVARRSGARVVAWNGFEADAEVTAFARPIDANFNAVPLYREADPVVGNALVFKFIGAKLAADFLASGGNGPRSMVLDDASEWPTTFPFKFFVSKLPDTGPDKKTFFTCTARSGNTLTVTYFPYGTSEFDSGASFTDRFIGDAAGSECQNYTRLFSAMSGADNGKGAADPADGGALPVRSRISGNANYVPQTPSLFGYGYCAHPDYAADARFSPWVPNYQGSGAGDSTSRANITDTSELFIQFRIWMDWNTRLPDMTGGKVFGIQSETTVPQQIVMGVGPGGGSFSIPSTSAAPFALSKFNYATRGSAGLAMAADAYSPNGSSYQPGSPWAATAIHATSGLPSTGQATPDGSSAFEHKYGRWVTFLYRIKPGKNWHYAVPLKNNWDSSTQTSLTMLDAPDDWPTTSIAFRVEGTSNIFAATTRVGAVLSGITLTSGSHVNIVGISGDSIQLATPTPATGDALSTELEVKVADFGATAYTTLFSVANYPINYGSRGQYSNFFDSAIPGFSACDFWGYRNSELSVATAPFKTLYQRIAQVIISRATIPVPNDRPAWRTAMAANTWCEIPTTNTLSSLDPATLGIVPGGSNWVGTRGLTAGAFSWCGGVWDESRLIFRLPILGGHNDYGGNAPYRVNIGANAPTFSADRLPSGATGMPAVDALGATRYLGVYDDGRRRPGHSYNNQVYVPSLEAVVVTRTAGAFPDGVNTVDGLGVTIAPHVRQAYILDDAGESTLFCDYGAISGQGGGGTSNDDGAACFDPTRGNLGTVWVVGCSTSRLIGIDVETRVATARGASENYFGSGGTMVYIPGLDVLAFVGPGTNFTIMRLDTGGTTLVTPSVSGSFSAGFEWNSFSGAAVSWDEKAQRLLLWCNPNNRDQISTLTPSSLTNPSAAWTRGTLTVSGSNTVIPPVMFSSGQTGSTPFGRGVYSKALGGFLLVGNTTQKPHFFAME